jgi:hypothetical protein
MLIASVSVARHPAPMGTETKIGPVNSASLLIESILMHVDVLALDEKQIASLSRLYWSSWGERTRAEVVSNVISTLSPEQFGAAVSHFVENNGRSLAAIGTDSESIDAMVVSALEKLTKDKSLIEIELASKVADRPIVWAKIFGVFVAVPVAILLLILSVFGLSKFEDVRKAADRADELLKQAESRVSDGNAKLELAERKVTDLINTAKQRAQVVDDQLAVLGEKSAKTSSELSSLVQTVKGISAAKWLQQYIDKPNPEGHANMALVAAKARALGANFAFVTEWVANPKTDPQQLAEVARQLGWPGLIGSPGVTSR